MNSAVNNIPEQKCIPVGCVLPACCPYVPSCTAPRGVYLVLGGEPGPRGVPGPGGCTWSLRSTWSQGMYLVPGGVPGSEECTWSQEVYLVPGGVPGLGVYLVWGVYLVLGGFLLRYSPCEQNHRHL